MRGLILTLCVILGGAVVVFGGLFLLAESVEPDVQEVRIELPDRFPN
ncbi:MAG: hypothetical protein KIS81_00525 [Maricaulaceae bacterium]|nr:hypothetical protein [Maricaulaceae bacterium]